MVDTGIQVRRVTCINYVPTKNSNPSQTTTTTSRSLQNHLCLLQPFSPARSVCGEDGRVRNRFKASHSSPSCLRCLHRSCGAGFDDVDTPSSEELPETCSSTVRRSALSALEYLSDMFLFYCSMVVRIMVMVPLYAIASLISLFSVEAAFVIDAIRDIYEVSYRASDWIHWAWNLERHRPKCPFCGHIDLHMLDMLDPCGLSSVNYY
jgi:hypothetical protein